MTAEIAILNKIGVALAADSAISVTLRQSGRLLTISDHKIFELTEAMPVAILIHGNAEFMAIPLEMLIKDYRLSHGSQRYSRFREYVAAFLDYLQKKASSHLSADEQERSLVDIVSAVYREMEHEIYQEYTWQRREGIQDNYGAAAIKVISSYELRANHARRAQGISQNTENLLWTRLAPRFSEARTRIFIPELLNAHAAQLDNLAYQLIGSMAQDIAAYPSKFYSGIVFAGYGQDEVFPSCLEIRLEGLHGGMLKAIEGQDAVITLTDDVFVLPFAQRDMVHMFMRGINYEYTSIIQSIASSELEEYTEEIIARFWPNDRDRQEWYLDQIRTDTHSRSQRILDRILAYSATTYTPEILDVLRHLPEDQLADVAEALIGLTSMRRRLSYDEETVGGATDVATITKGDGLQWVRRK